MRLSGKCELRLEVGALFQAEAPHPPVEIGSIGLEDTGGFGHVAFGLYQCRSDEVSFEFFPRLLQWEARLRRGRSSRRGGRNGRTQHLPDRWCVHHGPAQNAET